MLGGIIPIVAQATPGDTLVRVTLPVPAPYGLGIGLAADCDGYLYYTNSYVDTLYKIDGSGLLLDRVPLTDAANGAAISFGAISWDRTRDKIWAGTDHDSVPIRIYLVDPVTGVATYRFDGCDRGIGFCDGIAYDGTDNTIWQSDDIDTLICHFDTTGAYLGSIKPTSSMGYTLGRISGHVVGKGNILYVGRDGAGEIVKVDKTTGNYISSFATIGGRDEDLECDLVNFAPLEVLWSKDAYDNTIMAIEVEEGTCICAGEPEIISVDLDIKPQSCPNPFNPKSGGVVPVAILGRADFDVTTIDPASALLDGVAPLRWSYEDVGTPVGPDAEPCDCTTMGPDGFTDLTLKFNSAEIAALGPFTDGEVRVFTIAGELMDGLPFEGSDCMIMRVKGVTARARLMPVALDPGRPNPFNPVTEIGYTLQTDAHVKLSVYDISGRLVDRLVEEVQAAGEYSVVWDARGYASGAYFCRLEAGDQVRVQRLMLLK
jgi:hypothetical protein